MKRKRSVFWDGVRARSRATVITRVTRHTTVTHPPHTRVSPSNGETTGSYRRSLSCQPKGQPHYATYGAPESRVHLLSENRAEGSIENLNNLDRNSHASQDVSAAPPAIRLGDKQINKCICRADIFQSFLPSRFSVSINRIRIRPFQSRITRMPGIIITTNRWIVN